MPRLDNPNIKLKQTSHFKRQNLRPWDDPYNFIPAKILEDIGDSKNTYLASHETLNKEPTEKQKNNDKTNVEPTVNVRGTESNQLVNELVNKNETNGKQLAGTLKTISNQLVNELVNKNETNSNPISKHLNQSIDSNLCIKEISYEESLRNIRLLVGLQRKALFYIVENCKIGGLLYTSPITNEFLKSLLNTNADIVKTTIQRLITKGIIKRKEGKKGNGGFTIFSITESVRNAVTEIHRQMNVYSQLETNSKPKGNELGNNKETNKETNASIVSSSYINTTTTLPNDFKQIDCSPLSDMGFDESHIIQIHREYMQKPEVSLSADIIQNSINALAFDLKYNNAINDFKRPPAVVLTYLLKKGQPYSSKTPEKVLTPREESMREYLFSQEKKNLKLLEMEATAKNFALLEWLDKLQDEELFSFNPDNNIRPNGMPEKLYQVSKRKKALELAKEYFDVILWPKKRSQILSEECEAGVK